MQPIGDGCQELVEGELTVSIPFFGKKIEPEIAKGIKAAIRAEEKTGQTWLAQVARRVGQRRARSRILAEHRGWARVGRVLTDSVGGGWHLGRMNEPTELLMLTSVVHHCADCGDERLFVAVEIDLGSEFACTDCGAAVMIDPAFEYRLGQPHRRVA